MQIQDVMNNYKTELIIMGCLFVLSFLYLATCLLAKTIRKIQLKNIQNKKDAYDASIQGKTADRLFAKKLIELMQNNKMTFNTRDIMSMQSSGCDMLGYSSDLCVMGDTEVFCINGYAYKMYNSSIRVYELTSFTHSRLPEVKFLAKPLTFQSLSYSEKNEIEKIRDLAHKNFNPMETIAKRKLEKELSMVNEVISKMHKA